MAAVIVDQLSIQRTRREQILAEFRARLETLGYAHSTVLHYRLAALRLFKTYPDVPLEMITAEHIERHLYALKVTNRTKCVQLEQLRAFFKYLVRMKVLPKNPCRDVEKPRWQFRQRPAPTWENFLALRAACRTHDEALLIELPYWTGLRLGEFRLLKLSDVDLKLRRIRVVGKGSKERVVVFPPRVADLIAALDRKPGDWLCRPRSKLRVGDALERIAKRTDLPYHLTAHLLRHGFTKMCKLKGMPLDVAAKLLGHNSILTTSRIYGQIDIGEVQSVYDEKLVGVEVPQFPSPIVEESAHLLPAARPCAILGCPNPVGYGRKMYCSDKCRRQGKKEGHLLFQRSWRTAKRAAGEKVT